MSRCLVRLALACLVNMTLVLQVMAAPRVWVALAEEGGPYAEVATVLKEELGAGVELSVVHWRALFNAKDEAPDLIVAVGVAALDGVLERLGKRNESPTRVPLLAVMVPQAVFEARLAANQVVRRSFSAALLDQPLSRQLALIKRALPQYRRLGVLVGPQTRVLIDGLEKEALAQGFVLRRTQAVASADDIYPALKQALEEAEVILALPDPLIYNNASLQNILLTTYRARTPLVAFSPSYVKAGAMLAVYSTPAQVARRAVEMVRQWQSGRGLPTPKMPLEFEVAVNERVAASLGLWIDAPSLIVADLRRQENGR
jgi:putative tryptophan/tyrosine transport system substrate-binding protein